MCGCSCPVVAGAVWSTALVYMHLVPPSKPRGFGWSAAVCMCDTACAGVISCKAHSTQPGRQAAPEHYAWRHCRVGRQTGVSLAAFQQECALRFWLPHPPATDPLFAAMLVCCEQTQEHCQEERIVLGVPHQRRSTPFASVFVPQAICGGKLSVEDGRSASGTYLLKVVLPMLFTVLAALHERK
jgi:hypothetical protein